MTVDDVSSDGVTAGWLRAFAVNSSSLANEHRLWLDRHIVTPLGLADQLQRSSSPYLGSSDSWKIWIIGTASRTATMDYNLALSQRRAKSVEQYLASKLVRSSLVWEMSVKGVSEIPAMLRGMGDEVESVFDRAVLVVMFKAKNTHHLSSLPKLRKPSQISVEFYFYANRRSLAFNASTWEAEFYAVYKFGGAIRYDGWIASATGIGVDPTIMVKSPPLIGKGEYIFAGPDREVFSTPKALDLLNDKTIYVGTRGSKLTLRIEKARQDGRDIDLAMRSNTSVELTQAVGSLRKRHALKVEARDALRAVIRSVKYPTIYDKDGHIVI